MEQLGSRLRAARTHRRLSLRALATSIGVSPSLLSQIENGKSNPSVETLHDLSSQLGISLDALVGRDVPLNRDPDFPPDTDFVLQRAEDGPVLEMENGVRWERHAVIPGLDIQSMRVTYQPGTSSSIEGKFTQHFGYEFGSLLSGELTLCLEFDEHVLRPGDSFALDSQRPHLLVNRGSEPAVGEWFVFGRRGRSQQSQFFERFAVPKFTEGLNSPVDILRSFDELQ